jgi:hypothetical protein
MKFDLEWIEPPFPLEGAREELVRLMKIAIVAAAMREAGKEGEDDKHQAPEDRS